MTDFSYLVLSDIHLGARSTTAAEILDHLTQYFDNFSDHSELAKIDAFFLAGDLWDNTIQVSSEVVDLFIPWFHRFLSFAARNNIIVRIMEGTPSHDRRQGKMLARLFEVSNLNVDFKYVSQLSIEYIEKFQKHILYVPDECRPTADIIQSDIETLLIESRIDKVDIAIMHGMFSYQLGFIPMNSHVLDEAWYLNKVKNYIHIGHIHTASQYNRILAQGSFDRLAHGEEEPKGGILVKQLSDTEYGHFFIENVLAKKYKTIPVKGTVEQALKTIDKAVKHLPHGSFVRIQAISSHPIFQGFETLIRKYPLFTFSKKAVAEDEEVQNQTQETKNEYVPVILNEMTLIDAVMIEVIARQPLLPEEELKLRTHLEDLQNA